MWVGDIKGTDVHAKKTDTKQYIYHVTCSVLQCINAAVKEMLQTLEMIE